MSAEWELRVCERDLTRIGSFCVSRDVDALVTGLGFAADTVSTDVEQFSLQETQNDVGGGQLVLPIAATANDWMVEHRLLLLYVRGEFVTGAMIGGADDNLLQVDAADNKAAYRLLHLNQLLNEWRVDPARGMGQRPPGDDRMLDSSDPQYPFIMVTEWALWVSPDELMSVTAAQTGWELTPLGDGFGENTAAGETNPADDAQMVGPPGFSATPDPAPDSGYRYVRGDESTDGGAFRAFIVGDDGYGQVRIDGTNEVDQLVTQFGRASTVEVELSPGARTFWSPLVQSEDPDNPGNGLGPTAFAFALAPRLQNDQVGTAVVVSSSSWKMWNNVTSTPGYTVGGMGVLLHNEGTARSETAVDAVLVLTRDFDADNDSAGDGWEGPVVRSTKSGTSVGTFFMKELGEDACDVLVAVVDGVLTWRLFPKNGRGQTVAFALAPGVNIGGKNGGLTITRDEAKMTAALVRGHSTFREASVPPAAGHPRIEALLQLGAAQTDPEIDTIVAAQLNVFGRTQEKVAVGVATGRQTPDDEMPGLAYWVGDTINVPTTRELEPAAARIIAMTVEKLPSGQLGFTPEFGDLIVAPRARPAQTLAKLAPGVRSRVAAPPSL